LTTRERARLYIKIPAWRPDLFIDIDIENDADASATHESAGVSPGGPDTKMQ